MLPMLIPWVCHLFMCGVRFSGFLLDPFVLERWDFRCEISLPLL
jgi:hypothetical protein